jgi:hypothetical protein
MFLLTAIPTVCLNGSVANAFTHTGAVLIDTFTHTGTCNTDPFTHTGTVLSDPFKHTVGIAVNRNIP